MADDPPAEGAFVVTRLAGGRYGVARGGEVVSIHASREEAEAMVAALARHGGPPLAEPPGRSPVRPS